MYGREQSRQKRRRLRQKAAKVNADTVNLLNQKRDLLPLLDPVSGLTQQCNGEQLWEPGSKQSFT